MSGDSPRYDTVRVVDSGIGCPSLPIVDGAGEAKAVIWPGNGGVCRTFQVVDLAAGARTVDLRHPSDSAYYVSVGGGHVVDLASGASQPIGEGTMLHIDRGDGYRFEASATDGLRLIGGPCPADPALYAHLASASEAN